MRTAQSSLATQNLKTARVHKATQSVSEGHSDSRTVRTARGAAVCTAQVGEMYTGNDAIQSGDTVHLCKDWEPGGAQIFLAPINWSPIYIGIHHQARPRPTHSRARARDWNR